MHLLITEDEASVARRLQRLLEKILGDRITSLHLVPGVQAARHYLAHHPVDLLLLDLNLNGEDGFSVLQHLLAEACDVIIVSAYGERALEAFEYGVLDFVPKPFSEARLRRALERFMTGKGAEPTALRKLAVKKQGKISLINVEDILYVQGTDIYATLYLRPRPNAPGTLRTELSEKTLEGLERLLPANFARIHKSYIVDMNAVQEILVAGGGRYHLLLEGSLRLPLGRTRYQAIRQRFFG